MRCVKSLYKSTYCGYAFTQHNHYTPVKFDDQFIYFRDEMGNEFEFSRYSSNIFYYIGDYFDGDYQVKPCVSLKMILKVIRSVFTDVMELYIRPLVCWWGFRV